MKLIRSQSTTRRRKRSMQYYRLWIYSCNGVLGVTSATFAIFAAFVLADVRLSLLGGVELYHPTFLYAYTALILQCGVVQTIGCLGAQRLSHKLLSVYWILLLLLTIGDVVVGLVWVFKLDKVKLNLRPVLTREFISKYSTDESFTRTWNKVQSEEHCCGVDGPLDYDKLSQVQSQHSPNPNPNSSLIVDVESSFLSLPESCCIVIYDPAPLSSSGGFSDSLNQTHRSAHNPLEKEFTHPFNRSGEDDHEGGDRSWDYRTNSYVMNKSNSEPPDIVRQIQSQSDINYDSLVLNDAPLKFSDSAELVDELVQDNLITVQHLVHVDTSNVTQALSPGWIKHKVRHGNHRLKIPPHTSPVTASNGAFQPLKQNDTSVEVSEEIPIENRNRTYKGKPKPQKFFPSFSFSRPHPNPQHTTTPQPEYAEKLPVPFTCQRHPRIRNKQQIQNDIYQSYYNNKLPEPSNPSTGTGDDIVPTESSDRSDGSSANEIPHFLSDSNDEKQTLFLQSEQSQEFQERKGNRGNRKRRKRSPKSEVASAPTIQPMVGPNLFSFLHASPFTSTDGERNDINSLDGSASGGGESSGSTATEIQTAYYFSSFYQSNSFNTSLEKRFHVFSHGCGVKLIQWVDHVSGILFILGFCIIGFVKACFLVILRTEIKEMIEKIQILELDDPVSPSRAHSKDQRLHHVSHPLLAHPHRASTVSAHAYNAALPTIRSPEGSAGPNRFTKSYNQRRHSNIIGDRSQSHSQETVNMTLLVTNNSGNTDPCASGGCRSQQEPRPTEKGRSNPNLSICGSGYLMGREEFDPNFCISVPNTSRYLRRSSTCATSANPGQSYSSYLHYDGDPKPGPSSRFYHHEPPYHPLYHQHCTHGHYPTPRSRLYTRNMSIGAVIHYNTNTAGPGTSDSTAFRTSGGGSGSGNCSFSSRDENEILSASMDNVGGQSDQQQSEDEKEKERREEEIRDWAASTACTVIDTSESGRDGNAAPTAPVSLGDYTKAGFNHSSDSAESNDRNPTGRRNGNNNVDVESIPLSYLGTAV